MALNENWEGVDSIIGVDSLTYSGSLENLKEVEKDRRFRFIQGNICDEDLMKSLVSEVDAIVNFAAESHVDRSIVSSSEFIQSNLVGVQVLLDAVKASKKTMRFLQVSTDEVYGSIETGSWVESDPLLPNSPYSASKAGAELLVRAYNKTHQLDTLVTRCSNNYGPFQWPEKLIPLFITNLLEGKNVTVYGDGKNMRDWLHVDDHCRGIHLVLTKGRTGETYNIGGGTELSNLEITHLILGIMGVDKSRITYVEDRKGHDFRYSVDWSKINNELAYEPTKNFETELRKTAEWYQVNQEWWKKLKAK
jgi:dTDP-glucose 4,6-dehydratase